MDTRNAGSPAAIEDAVCDHLDRHAIEPAVVEMARPLLRRALAEQPAGPYWLTLEWDDTHALLRLRPLPDGPLPGEPAGPGLTRAHEVAARLHAEHADGPEVVTVDLNVARPPERDIDPPPADPDSVDPDRPIELVGLIAGEIGSGHSLEEAAARAGATLAERAARTSALSAADSGPDDTSTDSTRAESVADAIIAAEHELGADFEKVVVRKDRIVLRNRRCPFGPAASPAMCRFTSALAGGIGARAAGRAEVAVTEALASGDHECRLTLDLGRRSDRRAAPGYERPRRSDPPPDRPAPRRTRGFQVTLSLQLPRDRLSVPVTRHLIRAAMHEVGVVAEDGDAVELAVTEACANVIDHSGPGDAYDVAVTISPTACHIRVVDVGRGFDHRALTTPQMAGHDAEHGRGMALMHALVDQVRFESEPERGTMVHLVKLLTFDETSTARRLMREAARVEDAREAAEEAEAARAGGTGTGTPGGAET